MSTSRRPMSVCSTPTGGTEEVPRHPPPQRPRRPGVSACWTVFRLRCLKLIGSPGMLTFVPCCGVASHQPLSLPPLGPLLLPGLQSLPQVCCFSHSSPLDDMSHPLHANRTLALTLQRHLRPLTPLPPQPGRRRRALLSTPLPPARLLRSTFLLRHPPPLRARSLPPR